MQWIRQRPKGPVPLPLLLPRLREHFGMEPGRLPIVSQKFDASEHPNLQGAIDAYLAGENRTASLLGMVSSRVFRDLRLAELVAPRRNKAMGDFEPVEGPVEYANFDLAEGRVMSCVNVGLYLISNGSERLAVLLLGPDDSRPLHKSMSVEVMAPKCETAERFLSDLRDMMRTRNVYRGQVLSLSPSKSWGDDVVINFHKLPAVRRDQIILPEGLLQRIERQTLEFSRHCEQLRERRTAPATGDLTLRTARYRQDSHGHVSGRPNAGADHDSVDRPRPRSHWSIMQPCADARAIDGDPRRRQPRG